jgi:hypothetical protein
VVETPVEAEATGIEGERVGVENSVDGEGCREGRALVDRCDGIRQDEMR